MEITQQVQTDLRVFMEDNIELWRETAVEVGLLAALDDGDDPCSMDITFAVSYAGDAWAYQTGDNSYVGACYHLPYWAATSVQPDTTVDELFTAVVDELAECGAV